MQKYIGKRNREQQERAHGKHTVEFLIVLLFLVGMRKQDFPNKCKCRRWNATGRGRHTPRTFRLPVYYSDTCSNVGAGRVLVNRVVEECVLSTVTPHLNPVQQIVPRQITAELPPSSTVSFSWFPLSLNPGSIHKHCPHPVISSPPYSCPILLDASAATSH